ncbi:MAG: hypothetical protein ABWZ30_03160, partial [Jiangellaceae bacterium]
FTSLNRAAAPHDRGRQEDAQPRIAVYPGARPMLTGESAEEADERRLRETNGKASAATLIP